MGQIDLTTADAIGISGGDVHEIRGGAAMLVNLIDGDGIEANQGYFFRDPADWRKFTEPREEGVIRTDIPAWSHTWNCRTEEEFDRHVEALKRGGYHGGCLFEPMA